MAEVARFGKVGPFPFAQGPFGERGRPVHPIYSALPTGTNMPAGQHSELDARPLPACTRTRRVQI